jgi:hypothetical protein
MIISIEIKPYLKKWLISQSVNGQEPVRFANKSYFNALLLRLLSNFKSQKYFPVSDRDNVINHTQALSMKPDTILIQIPWSRNKDRRVFNYMSVNAKKEFRIEVKNEFYFELERHIRQNLRKGKRRNDTISEFIMLYGISEDDVKTESLYRQSTRILKKKNICTT